MKGVNETSQQSSSESGWLLWANRGYECRRGSAWCFAPPTPPDLSFISLLSFSYDAPPCPPYVLQRGPMIHKMRNHRDGRGDRKALLLKLAMAVRCRKRSPPPVPGGGGAANVKQKHLQQHIHLFFFRRTGTSPAVLFAQGISCFKGSRQWHLTVWPHRSPLRPLTLTPPRPPVHHGTMWQQTVCSLLR